MATPSRDQITDLLIDWSNGDQAALNRLMPLVYDELRRLASHYVRHERPGHTLQTTALVHEAYLKLVDQKNVKWETRVQFFAATAQVMRHVLVDYARSRKALKRGRDYVRLSIDDAAVSVEENGTDLLSVDEALNKLAAIDAQQSRVVELRVFGGLTVEETAEALAISPRTVKREWSMSPEQARGQVVDARTDIWSLGVMLYEMIAERQPFEGETASDVMSLILQKEPLPLTRYAPEVPAELERIAKKALRKDKEERYQTVKDLSIDLRSLRKDLEHEDEIERSLSPTSIPKSGQSTAAIAHTTSSAEYIVTGIKQHKRAVALILGTVVLSAAGWYWLTHRTVATKDASALRNVTFTQLTEQAGPEYFPSLAPDGKSFVYASYAAGNWDIYLQRVGGKNAINLTKDSPADDTQPAFSPDGNSIAFRSERDGGGIFVMGATGESAKRLTDFGFNPSWAPRES